MGKDDISIFNGEVFHTWQIKLKGYLMKKNLWGIVKAPIEAQEAEGTQTRASTSTTTTQALTKDDPTGRGAKEFRANIYRARAI